MPKLLSFPSGGQVREKGEIVISDLKILDAKEMQESMPLANMAKYRPDDWNAFVTYKVNHTLPHVAGPLASGNFTGYHPQVVAKSYESLLWRQNNMNHKLKALSADNTGSDRICGCVIGVHFPIGDWSKIPATREAAPAMTCVATVFKQAQGVPKMIGEHLSSKQTWSISLETVFPILEAAVWLPDSKRIVPMEEVANTPKMMAAVKRTPAGFQFGKYQGEQMVVMPGGTANPITYYGVGYTTNPGEQAAYIETFLAERGEPVKFDDGLMLVAAEALPLASFGRGVTWEQFGRTVRAKVLRVTADGLARLGLASRRAKAGDPVLEVQTPDGTRLLRQLSSVKVPA